MQRYSREIDEIFLGALERQSMQDRRAYLDQECAGDSELRQRVERLLAAQPEVENFLESPAPEILTAAQPLAVECPGAQIGPYKLRELLGEGGFGLVYVAEQEQPIRRKVALKVIKPGMDTREVIARFEAERQALALMDHPNIAKVLDAGTTGGFGIQDSGFRGDGAGQPLNPESRLLNPSLGRPYFVMELVRGLPITDHCERHKLTDRERLSLFVTVCRAVQNAHLKGIIHRDLKPSNVMVTLYDGVPVPKVIDFGVAKALKQKLTEHTLYTRHLQFIGTPLYMSPEQAELSGLDIDTRTDVYSLGVLLYELLTGTPPFDKQTLTEKGLDEFRRIVREVEPQRPSVRISTLNAGRQSTLALQRGSDRRKVNDSLKSELDWIVMKALEKDRNRRYESASDLADDVQRYLDDEPVAACPPSTSYRVWKFVRHNQAVLATAAIILTILVAATAVSMWLAISATRAEHLADERLNTERKAVQRMQTALDAERLALSREQETQERVYPLNIANASRLFDNASLSAARDLLSLHVPRDGMADRRGFEWYHLWNKCHASGRVLRGHTETVFCVSFSPNGQLLVTASGDDTARVWITKSGELLHVLRGHANDVNSATFSPVGTFIATAGDDRTIGIWDANSGRQVATLTGHKSMVRNAVYTPNGQVLASCTVDGEIKTWDVGRGEQIASIQAHRDDKPTTRMVAVSTDGTLLASCASDQSVKVWRMPMLQPVAEFHFPDDFDVPDHFARDRSLQAVAFRPGTDQLFVGFRHGGCFHSWDLGTGERRFYGETDLYFLGMAFSPDGRILATSSRGIPSIRQWTIDPWGVQSMDTLGHAASSWCVAFSPDGRRYAAGIDHVGTTPESCQHNATIIDLDAAPAGRRLVAWPGGIDGFAIAPDGNSVIAGCGDGALRAFDLRSGVELQHQALTQESVTSIRFSGDGKLLATGSRNGRVFLRDPDTFTPITQFQPDLGAAIKDLSFSADGRMLAACSSQAQAVWDTATSKLVTGSGGDQSLDITPDDNLIASTYGKHLPDGRVFHLGYEGAIQTQDISPDGTRAVIGRENGQIMILDPREPGVRDFSPVVLHTHSRPVTAVAFSRNGQTIATADNLGTVSLWDAHSGQLMIDHLECEFKREALIEFEHLAIEFTPDDSALICGGAYVTEVPIPDRKGLIWAWYAPRD